MKGNMKTTMKTTMKNMNVTMSGQEKYSGGMDLRWAIGTDESGPAKIYNSIGHVVYDGTYAGAIIWLKNRGEHRVGEGNRITQRPIKTNGDYALTASN